MLFRLFRKIKDATGLFNGYFIEVKALYALEFDAVCCVSFIGEIDTTKAFALINEKLKNDIAAVYQHSYFDQNEERMFCNNTIFVLTNKRIIELGNNWCQFLHTPGQYEWANKLIKQLSAFRMVNKEPAIGFARQSVSN
ncbi:MAG: hypothetical protein ACJ75B_19045 [Flavisolibacter sp.]